MNRRDGGMASRHGIVVLGLLGLLLWGLVPAASAEAATTKVLPLARPGQARAFGKTPPVRPVDPAEFERLARRRQESERRVRAWLGPHGVSQKGLDQREARLARLKSGKACADNPEVLNVVLIRIAFDEDRSGSLTSVTTDGNFLLDPDDSVIFDPPPHDKNYFQAHLDGLAMYWNSMSGGALTVNARVLPEGDQDAYFLSDIADYGPGSGGFWTIARLVSLVQDMIVAADEGTQADGSLNLAEFDFDDPNTYIIFAHAGGDLQSNLVTAPGDGYSPNDIPTFFVQLGDDDQVPLTSVDPDTNQPGLFTECSVIPETTSQDGLLGSIAAALYHEFGHALGLPDLYSTFTGLPTVGYWDLMDNGTNLAAAVQVETEPQVLEVFQVVGLLPPSISIWSKWYLGWVDEQVVGGRLQEKEIVATHRQDDCRKALRLDVSGDEFFLAENRWIPVFGQNNWALISDQDTGVVQFLGQLRLNEDPVNTHLYDFFLPWSGGMFLWRVRQDRIEANVAFNTVQSLPHTLGVELIEADGIKDIGVLEFSTRGFVGSDNDAFRQGAVFVAGPDTIMVPTTETEITPTSTPNTDSTFGFPTGATILDIPTMSDASITVTAGIAGLVDLGADNDPVWPVELPIADGEPPLRGVGASLTVVEFGDHDAVVVEAAPADGAGTSALYAYGVDGAPLVGADPRLLGLSAPLSGPPVCAPGFGGGLPSLVTVTQDGTAHVLQFDGATLSQAPNYPVFIGGAVDAPPLVLGTGSASLIVGTSRADNAIYYSDVTGNSFTSSFDFTNFQLRSVPVAVSLGPGQDRLGFVAGGRVFVTFADGTIEGQVGMSQSFNSLDDGRIWMLAWPDPAGGPDRLFVMGEEEEGSTFLMRAAFEGNQWVMHDFGRRLSTPPVSEPALADLDGDGRLEVFVATERRLWARNDLGVEVTGFPVRLEDRHLTRELEDDRPLSNVVVADLDLDGLNEVAVGSTNGLLHVLEYDGTVSPGWPRRLAAAGATNQVADFDAGATRIRGLFSFEARGDTLDSGAVLRSPRLAALDLGEAPPGDPADRPAEWLGLGGGPQRGFRGPTGALSSDAGPRSALAASQPMVYPNPVRGSTTRVRFFSGASHTSLVTLYNLEGEAVRTQEQFNGAGAIGEVALDMRFLTPGAYIARVQYTGRSGPATDFLTVYIE